MGYVAAKWGNLAVVTVYFLPSMSVPTVTRSLDEIDKMVQSQRPALTIVTGDFNAKARA